ncbi:nicotinic acid mononucleotide adenyltransferase [Bizionia argentinensis JUB59]|uniref:Nicotinic acid mononucleotide adenyltransferase n=1 Tax=Bizionia argentinensis JUB59 TaxID=1046627 RepID=G2ECU7_9FLAO|nr:hypothetical protein [Bizionia argentinensis]EGV43725.1 nicotinic acid mononucleotide adenyltransferase [Bizionia argentinensis JUB59]
MKSILLIFTFLISAVSFAQQERTLKFNEETNVIDVVYYHDNGIVSQTGSYNLDSNLQGEWLRFNTAGEKIVSAIYDNGIKVGKWFYWTDNTLKEVDYISNVIANVNTRSKSNVGQRD